MGGDTDGDDPLIGQVLQGKLEVIRQIGMGGMGVVYEVEHKLTRHRRALKILHAQVATDANVVTRFVREAGVAGTLRSPYVVETLDAGRLEDGSPYLLMEMLEGEPLSAIVHSDRRLPVARAARIAWQTCEGLRAAHAAGIVHRDLKPENLFLIRDEKSREQVKILDFGISKFTETQPRAGPLTEENAVMGTPWYMSPEQVRGSREVDSRTDLYSVGVILYEALGGDRPFSAEGLPQLAVQIFQGECAPLEERAPDLDAAVVQVVRRAMHRDRDARFQSARELQEALRPFVDPADLPAPARAAAEPASAMEATMAAPSTRPPAGPVVTTPAAWSRTAPADGSHTWLGRTGRFGRVLVAAGVALLAVAGAVAWWGGGADETEPEPVAAAGGGLDPDGARAVGDLDGGSPEAPQADAGPADAGASDAGPRDTGAGSVGAGSMRTQGPAMATPEEDPGALIRRLPEE